LLLRPLEDAPVGLGDQRPESGRRVRLHLQSRKLAERLNREGRRHLTTLVAAHAVGDDKERRFAEHPVLVARALEARIAVGAPFDYARMWLRAHRLGRPRTRPFSTPAARKASARVSIRT